ncbi:MAG: hypothetical protein LBS50_06535 [Prevotellaceae bacterium]|jgi:hypothetical protein|nr:hypothetical protein [Prevotellaceae bacterium]
METIDKNYQFNKNPRKITDRQFARLESDLQKFGDLSGVVYCRNNKAYVGGNQRSKIFDGADIEIVKLFNNQPDKTVALGFIKWNERKYHYREVEFSAEEFREACIVANNDGGEWDFDLLKEWDLSELESWDFDTSKIEIDEVDIDNLFEDARNFNQTSKFKIVLEYSEERFNKISEKLKSIEESKEDIFYEKMLSL